MRPGPGRPTATLGVDLAVELVGGCGHAGVMMVSRDRVWSSATTDEVVRAGDELQHELGEGPCLDAIRFQHTVICHDLTWDQRWPRWGPQMVAEFGVQAILSLSLSTDRDTLGALNLYADHADPWSEDAITVGHMLAGQLAAAVADAPEIENRGKAIASRTVIGQAQGILMERYGINADKAFDYLRRVSQNTNRRLFAVADELVRSRRLPDAELASGLRPRDQQI